MCHLLSVICEQDVDFGQIIVIDLYHGSVGLVLFGLDRHSDHECVFVFCLLHSRLRSHGELGGTVVKPVSLGSLS